MRSQGQTSRQETDLTTPSLLVISFCFHASVFRFWQPIDLILRLDRQSDFLVQPATQVNLLTSRTAERHGRRQCRVLLSCDGALMEPGLAGNLIFNAFSGEVGEDTGKGKEQRKKRRIWLTALPAVPFEIVGR